VDVAKAVAAVRARGAGTAVLVKGSRAAKTERVVQALLARG
jgi:UDP-N-acetylmuramyl pentapeptide synthase